MTYKKKLMLFTELKKEHIQKFGIIYADHKDYRNIKTWKNDKCKMIYNTLVKNINFGVRGLTDDTCVWCIYNTYKYRIYYYGQYFDHCDECYYGKRYGECLQVGSLYKKYATSEIKRSFTNKVYKDMINEINLY